MLRLRTRFLCAVALAAVPLLALSAGSVHAASGGTSTVTVSAGSGLTLAGAVPGSTSVTLNGSDQTVNPTLAAYTAADTTGSGGGWNVTFQATQFACTALSGACPAGGDALPAGSLLMAAPTVACASGQSCTGRAAVPAIKISANTALDGSVVKVASATYNTGMGTYNFTPGAMGTGQLQLTVPSYAYASTYKSTLTVSIGTGP